MAQLGDNRITKHLHSGEPEEDQDEEGKQKGKKKKGRDGRKGRMPSHRML